MKMDEFYLSVWAATYAAVITEPRPENIAEAVADTTVKNLRARLEKKGLTLQLKELL